jgi:integrase
VTTAKVDAYITACRAAGKSASTINHRTQVLASANKLALRRGVVTTAPMVRKLTEAAARSGFFERDEFEAVAAKLPDYLQDAARFAYLTGWRKGEVVALCWEWVDLAAGTITLPTSKNGKPRTIAVSGDLVALLARREAARLVERSGGEPWVADYVFHRAGRPLGDFKKACGLDRGGVLPRREAAGRPDTRGVPSALP